MRNPMNSWDKSDSWFGITNIWDDVLLDEVATAWILQDFPDWLTQELSHEADIRFEYYINWLLQNGTLESDPTDNFLAAYIGPKDMELAQRLIKAGPEHRKFMRQIFVTIDITAPRYFWSEMDTYKLGTVSNSTSTMHKLASTPITKECFEIGDYDDSLSLIDDVNLGLRVDCFIDDLEQLRQKYLMTKDKKYWKELIRWLPESWLQTRTVTLNYENIRTMISQRKNHKLNEWSGQENPQLSNFVTFAMQLPYAKDLLLD